MQDYYIESFIIPTALPELFIDFILEKTTEAIEEIALDSLISSLKGIEDVRFYNIHSYKSIKDFPKDCTVIITRLEVRFESQTKYLINELKGFCDILCRREGSNIGFAHISQKFPNIDWIEHYKQHITPITCDNLYIRPSWYPPKQHLINIVIDPALAFGTGHHQSTFICVQMLQRINLKGKLALDVGCGSGILSIIMAKHGAMVESCDIDSFCIAQTKHHAKLNNVKLNLIYRGSIKSPTKTTLAHKQNKTSPNKQAPKLYDIICANITADVLIILHNDLRLSLKQNGILILGGILEEHKLDVLNEFADFRVIEAISRDEWIGLKMQPKNKN